MSDPITALEALPPPSSHYVQEAEARSLNFLNPKVWMAMNTAAQAFHQAKALPASMDNVGKVIMALQAGYEAGLQPIESLNSFYFVNGRLALYGDTAINLVIRAGHKVIWGECNAETATVTIIRKDDPEMRMTNTFTLAMAKARNINNPVLSKHPENFLKFKAFHMTAKFVCPDATRGQRIKELAEVEEEPEVQKPEIPTAPAIEGTKIALKAPQSLEAALNEPEAPAVEPDAKKPAKAKGKGKDVTDAIIDEVNKNEFERQMPPLAVNGDVTSTSSANPGKVVEGQGKEIPPPVAAPVEPPVKTLTDAEKYDQLIAYELDGKKLTDEDKLWIKAYQLRNK